MAYGFSQRGNTLIVDLKGLGKTRFTTLSIVLPVGYERPTIVSINDKTCIMLTHKITREQKFIELDIDDTKEKYKLPRKYVQPDPVASKPFHKLHCEDWRPKHFVQYVRYKYRLAYGIVPLEMQWDDKGYTKHAKDRSKCWAYAKHLFDKFDRANISKKRLKHYVDWCFVKHSDMNPTMALLSCNNWVDSYNHENRKKKMGEIVETDIIKKRSKQWDKKVKEMDDDSIL